MAAITTNQKREVRLLVVDANEDVTDEKLFGIYTRCEFSAE